LLGSKDSGIFLCYDIGISYYAHHMENIHNSTSPEELADMSDQEIAASLLPVLMPGEALLPDDIAVIRGLAEPAIASGTPVSEALLDAAAKRFEARRALATDSVTLHDKETGQVHVVDSQRDARELLGRE
jgi:hypothetical protein